MPSTCFDKIWDSHIVSRLPGGDVLLHIDRQFVLDLGSNVAFDGLRKAGRRVRNPELTFAIQDHTLATDIGRTDETYAPGTEFVRALRRNARAANIRLFDISDPGQGIVHVVAPEQGLALPGCTIVTGDSHTSTPGGIGALAFGIGTSEVEHVLATQTIVTRKPRLMRVTFEGTLPKWVAAKDLILRLIGQVSAGGGTGYAVEYAGSAIRSLPVEGRLTICNMSIEFGARMGLVAPDEVTIDYVAGRPYAPRGELWDRAVTEWRSLRTDDDSTFDKEVTVDVRSIAPQVTWGTSPMDVIAIDEVVPDPAFASDADRGRAMQRAQQYMGVTPGSRLEGLKIDWAFIGSCTNSRLSDLQAAAEIVRGRKVAPGVRALIVPGSTSVKRESEALGLHRIFRDAGFDWRESACSLCAAANAERIGPGERCISSTNRNFEGRQGAGARTHLASPAMVAAAAVTGAITDVRKLQG